MTTTLTSYRRRAAKALGPYDSGTATSGSTTSLLECTSFPFKSTLSTDDFYQDQYLLRPSAAAAADKVRIVKTYDPANGQFTPDSGYANAAYTGGTGETFELHGIIEPLTAMTDLVNQALKRCFVVVEFTLAPVLQQTRHSLASAASWLSDPDWIYQVGWLDTNDDRDEVDPYTLHPIRGHGERISGITYLVHPGVAFSSITAQTIYVKAIKPAYYQCSANGGALGSQTGLNLENDFSDPDEEWVAAAVLIEAWQRYGQLLDQAGNQRLIRDRAEAAAQFSYQTERKLIVPERTFVDQLHFGPSRREPANRFW